MTHSPRNILVLGLLAFAAALMLATAGTATAAASKSKAPCWKVLINDWYDGRIDGTYPIKCYREALKHLPTDVDTYSSARDDIRQALQERITQGNGGGKGNGGTGQSSSGGASGNGSGSGGGSGSENTSGPIGGIINAGKPDSADSVPVPLIVLGGVALLLMAAGAAGFVARRQRTRKLQLSSAATLPHQGGGAPPERQ